MTTFTGIIHRDHWQTFLGTVLPQLLDPGFRDEDFKRLKDAQLNALVQDLRSNNEEELGKERLQTNIFRGTPYGHVALGTVAGLNAITLDDVRQFAQDDVHAGEPHARRERRCAGRDGARRCSRALGDAARRDRRRRAWPSSGTRPVGHRSGDPREGHARHRDLVRVSDRRDARASGLRGAVGRPRLARRAPPRVRPAVSADPRGPRHQLRRLRLHRGVPARDVPVLPRPERRAAAADLRDLDPAGRAGQRAHDAADRGARARPR